MLKTGCLWIVKKNITSLEGSATGVQSMISRMVNSLYISALKCSKATLEFWVLQMVCSLKLPTPQGAHLRLSSLKMIDSLFTVYREEDARFLLSKQLHSSDRHKKQRGRRVKYDYAREFNWWKCCKEKIRQVMRYDRNDRDLVRSLHIGWLGKTSYSRLCIMRPE